MTVSVCVHMSGNDLRQKRLQEQGEQQPRRPQRSARVLFIKGLPEDATEDQVQELVG